MTVYHGGKIERQNPDVIHSKKHLDFGRGFYVTSFPKQAEHGLSESLCVQVRADLQ